MHSNRGEVYPGIVRITLPLPFELKSVNVHLIRLDSGGYMLIDTGMLTDDSFAALQNGLREARCDWSDIRQILLTHIHPDHMGLAARLLHLTGARLLMHEAELRHLRVVNTPELRATWIHRAFTESCVPQSLQDRMQLHFLSIRPNFSPVKPDIILTGSEEIPTALGPLQILWTPGHSPGHICLYSIRHRLLISGDQILPTITPNISWLPERDTLADFLASLEALKRLEIDLILPSHGHPFAGHHAWIENTTAHHHQRCDEMRNLLPSPRTAFDLVADLWKKSLSPINQQFAVLEVMAHLEYLRRRQRIRSEHDQGSVQWCQ